MSCLFSRTNIDGNIDVTELTFTIRLCIKTAIFIRKLIVLCFEMKRWFRLRLRHYFKKPADIEQAYVVRRRLSFLYAFAAWNAFGLMLIYYLNARYPKSPSEEKVPALWYLRLIGHNEANVVTISGFSPKLSTHYDASTDSLTPVNTDSVLSLMSKNYFDESEELEAKDS